MGEASRFWRLMAIPMAHICQFRIGNTELHDCYKTNPHQGYDKTHFWHGNTTVIDNPIDMNLGFHENETRKALVNENESTN